jgi:hypothetical protein
MHAPTNHNPQPVCACAWKPGLVVCTYCIPMPKATYRCSKRSATLDRTRDCCGHICAGVDAGDAIYPVTVWLGALAYQAGTCRDCRSDAAPPCHEDHLLPPASPTACASCRAPRSTRCPTSSTCSSPPAPESPPPASSWGESGGPKHHPQHPCYLDCLQVVEVDDAVLNGSRDQGGFSGCRTPDRGILGAHPLQVCAHRGGRDV